MLIPGRLLLLAAMLAVAAPGCAQEYVSPLPDHLPLRADACFGRSYDAAHLRSHPKQRVTRFHLFRDFAVDRNAEEPPISSGTFRDQDGSGTSVGLTAFVGFRDRKGVHSNWLNCTAGAEGSVRCGVDCDGGGFKLRPDGASLLVENEGFVVTGGCGASEDENEQRDFVKPGTDDREFRLESKPLAACAAERDALKPSWVTLGAPIRDRLAKSDAVCFTRRYDAAERARHPKQMVKRIAVLKPDGTTELADRVQTYRLTFRVELNDGRRLEKQTDCWPDKYAYACTHDPLMDTVQDFYLTRAGDDRIALRDRRGRLAELFGEALGSDDRLFELKASVASACEF